MDYSRPERADRLAADFVTGTLRGNARARFQSLLPAHPALRRAVAEWQERLIPLTFGITAIEPPARVWQRIEARIGGTSAAAAASIAGKKVAEKTTGWRSLGLWRGFAGFATATALALAVFVANPPPSAPPLLVVLSTPAAGGAAARPSFVASVSGDGTSLVTRPIIPVSMQAGRALELWALPAQGAPRSLGLVSPDGTTALPRSRIQPDVRGLAVSVEPPGGSPTGAPTGPIIFTGSLTS
ncbi:anti-sigma factor [soil metagenome]